MQPDQAPTFWRVMPQRPFTVFDTRWCVFAVWLGVVGILVAFYSVVKAATTAGELRRQDTAAQAAAVTRCRALPNGAISNSCLKALNDPGLAMSPTTVAAR